MILSISFLGFPGGSDGKVCACSVGDWVRPLGQEDPLEKEITIHSSTLAWKIPWLRAWWATSPWGCKQSDKTERLHFHLSYLRIFIIILLKLTNAKCI